MGGVSNFFFTSSRAAINASEFLYRSVLSLAVIFSQESEYRPGHSRIDAFERRKGLMDVLLEDDIRGFSLVGRRTGEQVIEGNPE